MEEYTLVYINGNWYLKDCNGKCHFFRFPIARGRGGGGRSNSSDPSKNIKTLAYTIGIPGATGVNYNFSSAADANEQSIQLGSANIIPQDSPVISITVKCIEAITDGGGATTAANDVGNVSGGDQFISNIALELLNQILSVSAFPSASASASSVYFSITPGVNWNTLLTGKWKIWISYLDNSQL